MDNIANIITAAAVAPQQRPAPRVFDLGFLEPPSMPDSVKRMHHEAQRLLAEMATRGRSPRWLTLIGQSGCGKTYLSRAVRAIARDQLRMKAQYWNVSRIADRLRSGEYDLCDHLAALDFLVLDDLGAEHSTEFSRSKLYQILDSRLGKWTVVTSNLSLAAIADTIDVRCASRIKRGGVVVDIPDSFDYCAETGTFYRKPC